MVEAAVADVVSPAVAADDPDALANEVVRERQQVTGVGAVLAIKRLEDLALMAMQYGHVYVARVAFGAKDNQTVKAFQEAEAYPGTSIIIAYSPCIAHGYDMSFGLDQQKLAVDSAYWPLFRWDPRRVAEGKPGLVLDAGAPKVDVGKFMANETRFRMLDKTNPERAKMLLELAREQVASRWAVYENLARGVDPVAAIAAVPTTPKAN